MDSWIGAFRKIIITGRREIQYSIFVDAIDESLGVIGKDEHGDPRSFTLVAQARKSTEATYRSDLVLRIWLNAQKGFLFATHGIRDEYANINIVGSVRIEAVRSLSDGDYERLGLTRFKSKGALIATLDYTETELRQIFDLNVAATDPGLLAKPSSTDPLEQLFGFSKVRHRQVYGEVENLFDLILRHTFRSPRELVAITKAAIDSVAPAERPNNPGVIIAAIDKAAIEAFDDWAATVLPILDDAIEEAAKLIPKNVIRCSEISSVESNCGYGGLFNRLFSRGLIGYPYPSDDGSGWELHFWQPDGNERELPTSVDYVALHPALSAWICSKSSEAGKNRNFYNHQFVVGAGRTCPHELSNHLILLDISRDRDWVLSTIDPAQEIRLFAKNSFLSEATDERRLEAREFLCAILLAKKRQSIISGPTFKDLDNEKEHLRGAGLYQLNLRGASLPYWWSVVMDGDATHDLIKEITSELRKLDLGLIFHAKRKGENPEAKFGIDVPASVELCWRKGESSSKKWVSTSADEIALRVNQNRTVN
jgi:hypothetical protein